MSGKIRLKEELVAEAEDGDDIPESDDVEVTIRVGTWSRTFWPGRIIYDWWGPPYGEGGRVLGVNED